MATPVVMPRQGNTVESCTIVEWHKNEGDAVSTGEPLFTYETDKATFECESPADGVLIATFFETDEDIPVLTNVAVVGAPGEDAAPWRPSPPPGTPGTTPPPAHDGTHPPAQPHPGVPPVAEPDRGSAVPQGGISPRARMAAQNKGIAAAHLAGSGPHGRIIERDVLSAAATGQGLMTRSAASAPPTALPSEGSGIGGRITLADLNRPSDATPEAATLSEPEYTEAPLSKMRAIIADRMSASLARSAQLTMNASADASALLALRAKVKAQGEALGLNNITINDLVAFALTRVLPDFPALNCTVEGNTVRTWNRVHLAMAVDTPRGLMVPVVRNAHRLTLNALTAALKKAAAGCNDGSINPDELNGGTITISNLGAFGIESFTPIINSPQGAILGVNTIATRPVEGNDGQIHLVPHIGLSLTIDHRVVDGAPAARFLRALCTALTHFDLTLAR